MKGDRIAVVGLGKMGLPIARRLLGSGANVVGADADSTHLDVFAKLGGEPAPDVAAAVRECRLVVLVLPDSRVVESVLTDDRVRDALSPGTTVVDMGSSEPMSTRALAAELAEQGVTLIDAPVSGGVAAAEAGTLSIMAAGPEEVVSAVAPTLGRLGTVRRVGDVGAGHALKAINNLLSAVHLLATSEGIALGRRFGLDPEVMLDVLNASSGRSVSTEVKFPKYVVPETYDSGFAARLMLKDMNIATSLAELVGASITLGERAVEICTAAVTDLGPDGDQTELARWVWEQGDPGPSDAQATERRSMYST